MNPNKITHALSIIEIIDQMDYFDTSQRQTLLASLDSEDQMAERSRQSLAMQKQLTEPFISQEKKLSTLSLVQLYDVSLNHSGSEVEWSDYQVERARNVLDSTLAE